MKKTFFPLLAAAAFAFASCDQLAKPEDKDQPTEATQDTAVVYRDGRTAADGAGALTDNAGAAVGNAFDLTKVKLADMKFPEIKTSGITVRGNDDYQVYSVDEAVLFDTDKAAVKGSAAVALTEIMGSVKRRFADKDVRVLGFADARGDAKYNFKLAQERAEAVKNYLVTTGKMTAEKVSTESFGEQAPVASNATAEGRQENRRVEIAVRVR